MNVRIRTVIGVDADVHAVLVSAREKRRAGIGSRERPGGFVGKAGESIVCTTFH